MHQTGNTKLKTKFLVGLEGIIHSHKVASNDSNKTTKITKKKIIQSMSAKKNNEKKTYFTN